MFPIRDTNGSVVGFTGRIMPGADGKDDKKEAKYMNTPQTLVYDKSRVVFGLDKAKQSIRKEGRVVIVEGNMDVISSHQAGVENVVAVSGTALTAGRDVTESDGEGKGIYGDHLKLIKRFTDNLVFCFDNDEAGLKAMKRSYELAVADGFRVKVLNLPEELGKDADDVIKKSVDAWKTCINNSIPYMEWRLERTKAHVDFKNPDMVRSASEDLIAEISKINQPVERSHWIREVADMFRTKEELIAEAVEKTTRSYSRERQRKEAYGNAAATGHSDVDVSRPIVRRPKNRHEIISESVLAILCAWPDLMATAVAHLEADDLDAEFRPLYTSLIFSYNKQRSGEQPIPGPDSASAMPNISNISQERLTVLRLLAEKDYGELTGAERRDTLVRLSGEIKEHRRSQAIRELTEQMADAEKNGDKDAISKIHAQLKELLSKGTAVRPKL